MCKKLSPALVFALSFILFAGWSVAADQERPEPGGTLNYIHQYATPLDPNRCISRSGDWLTYSLFYESLLAKNEHDEIVPWLAKNWRMDGERRITLELRDDVFFHDGTKMDANAVKATLDWFLSEDNRASYAAAEMTEIENIVVAGEYLIEINLKSPSGLLLSALTDLAGIIISPKAIEDYKKSRNPIAVIRGGTGPFVFDSSRYIAGEQLAGVKNTNYYRKDSAGNALPYLDAVLVKISADEAIKAANLRSGDMDFCDAILDVSNLDDLDSDANITLKESGSAESYHLYTNFSKPPFDNLKVRQALAHAVDAEEIMLVVAGEYGKLEPWLVLPTQFYYKPSGFVEYDPEKAKALLAEAGYPKIKVELHHLAESVRTKGAQVLQAQLKRVGIETEIVPLDATAMKQVWNVANPDTPAGMILAKATIPRPDPYSQMYNNFGKNSGTNYGKCKNEEFLDLLDKVKLETNQDRRKEMLWEMQDIGLADVYCVFLHQLPRRAAFRNSIKGVRFDTRGIPYFTEAWKSK